MDLGSTIISAIFIAICIVPIFLLNKNRKKREKKTLQSLIDIATQQECVINKHEACSNFVIGIDETKDFVFFFKQKEDEAIAQFVDLSKIKFCKAVKNTRTVKSKNGDTGIIEKIKLTFIPKKKGETETKFQLYDEENTQISRELELADKWSKLINSRLKSKK